MSFEERFAALTTNFFYINLRNVKKKLVEKQHNSMILLKNHQKNKISQFVHSVKYMPFIIFVRHLRKCDHLLCCFFIFSHTYTAIVIYTEKV